MSLLKAKGVMKLKCVLIDDEPKAREVMKAIIENHLEDLEIVAEAANLPEGVKSIIQERPHLVFLDVEMPDYSGLEIMDFFDGPIDFDIVFVTAYDQYALDAFQMSAVDYILKPVQIEHVRSAVNKVRESQSIQGGAHRYEALQQNLKVDYPSNIVIPVSDGLQFVELSETVMFKADGAYTKIFFMDKTSTVVSKKLKEFERVLVEHPSFYRCHRSYMVNIDQIDRFVRQEGGYLKMRDGNIASISRDAKDDFLEMLEHKRI